MVGSPLGAGRRIEAKYPPQAASTWIGNSIPELRYSSRTATMSASGSTALSSVLPVTATTWITGTLLPRQRSSASRSWATSILASRSTGIEMRFDEPSPSNAAPLGHE